MEDTLEQQYSPPAMLSQDLSASPNVQIRKSFKFENVKDMKDELSNLNQTILTMKEKNLDTEEDTKEVKDIEHKIETLNLQINKAENQNKAGLKIDIPNEVEDEIKQIAISQELEELHQDVRDSLDQQRKSILSQSNAMNQMASGLSMMSGEEEEVDKKQKQFVGIKQKLDGNQSYAMDGSGSVLEMQEPPAILNDVDTHYGNFNMQNSSQVQSSGQNSQRVQFTARSFKADPVKGKIHHKNNSHFQRTIDSTNDYDPRSMQIQGIKASLSPHAQSSNMNKNFIQVQLKTEKKIQVIDHKAYQKNSDINVGNKDQNDLKYQTREGSMLDQELNTNTNCTPLSTSTVPVNPHTPIHTNMALYGNIFKGNKQTRPKQTNLHLIPDFERSRSKDRQKSPTNHDQSQNSAQKSVIPKQDNIKQQFLMDRKVHVLMPTQYNSKAIIKKDKAAMIHGMIKGNGASFIATRSNQQGTTSNKPTKNPTQPPLSQMQTSFIHTVETTNNAEIIQPAQQLDTMFGQKRHTHVKMDQNDQVSDDTTPNSTIQMQRQFKIQSLTIDFNEQQEKSNFKMQQQLAKTSSITENIDQNVQLDVKNENVALYATSPANPKLDQLCAVPDSGTVQMNASSITGYDQNNIGRPKLDSKKVDDTKTIFTTNINKIEFKGTEKRPPKPKENFANIIGSQEIMSDNDYKSQTLSQMRSNLRSQGVPNSIQIKLNKRNKIQQNHMINMNATTIPTGNQPALYGSGYITRDNNKKSGSLNYQNSISRDNPKNSKDNFNVTLPNLIPPINAGNGKGMVKMQSGIRQNQKSNQRKRNKTFNQTQNLQDATEYKEIPIQYKNAFQNSFYNKEMEKMMIMSRQTGSKKSLVFSIKATTEEGFQSQSKNDRNSIKSPSPTRTNNNDINHFQIPRIKISNNDQNPMSRQIQSNEQAKRQVSMPINGSQFEPKTDIRAWSPSKEDDLLGNMNKLYFEQPDQILTNKQNYYYKQIRSLEKGQQIVISHPYDMSHMANTQKSFLTQNMLKLKSDRARMQMVKTAPKNQYRNFKRNTDVTPKERKEEWIRKAQIAQEHKIFNSKDTNAINMVQKGQLKGLPQNHVIPHDTMLCVEKLKMFDKGCQDSRAPTQNDEEAKRSKSRSLTPNEKSRLQGHIHEAFPNRQTPKQKIEDQVSGYMERRGIMNIHQQMQIKHLPQGPGSPRQQKFTNFDQIKTLHQQDLKASIGLGSYDVNNSSRMRHGSNEDINIQEHGTDQTKYAIKTARSNQPTEQMKLQNGVQTAKNLEGGRHNKSIESKVTGETRHFMMTEGESSHKFPTQIKVQKQVSDKKMTNDKHNFSFRNFSKGNDINSQFMNFQNQRESMRASQQTYGNQKTSIADSRSPRQTATARDMNDSKRLVAYSSLGIAKISQYKNSSVNSNGGISNRSKSPNVRKEKQSHDASPRSPQSSFNNPSHQNQRSIFFGNEIKDSTVVISKNSVQKPVKKVNAETNAQTQDNESQDYTHEPEVQENPLNASNDYVQSSGLQKSIGPNHNRFSPGLMTEKIKSLGRKQVSGFAGGVIGSAVNAKNYYMRNLRKSEESSRGRGNANGSQSRTSQDREIVNCERTLSIDSPQGQRENKKELQAVIQKQMNPDCVVGISVDNQKETYQNKFKNISLKIPLNSHIGIQKIQLTQRNITSSQITPTEQQAILMGAGSSDQNNATNNTQRSFKMDDILHELNQHGSNSSQVNLQTGEKGIQLSNKSDKFKPLNMKEIQLQHSARLNLVTSQDYANLLKEKQQRENQLQKRRSQVWYQRKRSQDTNHTFPTKKSKVMIQGDGEFDELNEKSLLDPQLVEFLKQKTLYKMQKDLWKAYEIEWLRFKKNENIQAQAPIPPSCRILSFHIYLNQNGKQLANMKNVQDFLSTDQDQFKECFKEAKRRLQMCSFRIIDENVFLDMKHEMAQGYKNMITSPTINVKRVSQISKNLIIENETQFKQYTLNSTMGDQSFNLEGAGDKFDGSKTFDLPQKSSQQSQQVAVTDPGHLSRNMTSLQHNLQQQSEINTLRKNSIAMEQSVVHHINEEDEDIVDLTGGD